MKNSVFAFLSLLIFATITSCCKPGSGGDATIVAFPQHHGKEIKGATVYIKYNAKDFPGTDLSKYDATFVGEAEEEHVHCKSLKCGKYYLYAIGFDSMIMQAVSGGIAIKVKHSEREKEIDMNIPVTE